MRGVVVVLHRKALFALRHPMRRAGFLAGHQLFFPMAHKGGFPDG
jgi:hypothetical protein